jgi:hypothetical protein
MRARPLSKLPSVTRIDISFRNGSGVHSTVDRWLWCIGVSCNFFYPCHFIVVSPVNWIFCLSCFQGSETQFHSRNSRGCLRPFISITISVSIIWPSYLSPATVKLHMQISVCYVDRDLSYNMLEYVPENLFRSQRNLTQLWVISLAARWRQFIPREGKKKKTKIERTEEKKKFLNILF